MEQAFHAVTRTGRWTFQLVYCVESRPISGNKKISNFKKHTLDILKDCSDYCTLHADDFDNVSDVIKLGQRLWLSFENAKTRKETTREAAKKQQDDMDDFECSLNLQGQPRGGNTNLGRTPSSSSSVAATGTTGSTTTPGTITGNTAFSTTGTRPSNTASAAGASAAARFPLGTYSDPIAIVSDNKANLENLFSSVLSSPLVQALGHPSFGRQPLHSVPVASAPTAAVRRSANKKRKKEQRINNFLKAAKLASDDGDADDAKKLRRKARTLQLELAEESSSDEDEDYQAEIDREERALRMSEEGGIPQWDYFNGPGFG